MSGFNLERRLSAPPRRAGRVLFRGGARALVGTLLAVAMLVMMSARHAALGEEPIFVNWPALLPSLTDAYDPNSANQCVAGKPRCVDATIIEMQRRFASLGQSCDHSSMFAVAYLRTTQTYEWARDMSGYFQDTPWVNHEDAVFAKYYFRAYDAWAAGKRDQVPPAWRIAFDDAAARKLTGSGDLLLGMNAHVNRDLPFALAAISITTSDGKTRKPDHDKVNQFLNAVIEPLLFEAAARLDPTVNTIVTPYGVGYTGLFQLLAAWREDAWRSAEQLTDAPTPAARAQVAQEIETVAAHEATTLAAANAYDPPLTTTTARDAYCAVHNADPPPMTYAFGTATAYGRGGPP
jgi:hypothetical protein